jgi:D-3-phosphoglycerate dehydrogenase
MEKKVLITSRSFGSVGNEPIEVLRHNGIEAHFTKGPGLLGEDEFIKALTGFKALIVGNDKVTAKVLAHSPELAIICKHGTGVDNIDVKAAQENNVTVTNVPATNADAVADLTFGLMLDVARRISFAAGTVKHGKWAKVTGVDVCGKCLGLIGLGAIGKRVAKRALGFDMRVIAFDPMIEKAPDGMKIEILSFEEVIKQCDFLSLHIPLNDKTKNLISHKEMAMMKKGSFIINAARGGVLDEQALYENLVSGHIKGAGLDVTENEPPVGSPLLDLENVTISPHMASHSIEAINAVSVACAKNVVSFFSGAEIVNIVK